MWPGSWLVQRTWLSIQTVLCWSWMLPSTGLHLWSGCYCIPTWYQILWTGCILGVNQLAGGSVGVGIDSSTCSLMNFQSSSNSVCDKHIFWLMSVVGAPAFSSIAWSHDCFSGNFFDSWLLNMCVCFWYGKGTKVFGRVVGLVVSVTLPITVWDIGLICRGRNHAFTVSGLHNTIGSWSWEIHPLAQLILGCVAANHRYPRMTRFSPRSERKYHNIHWVVPVLVCKSV